MSTATTSLTAFACVFTAALLGTLLRRVLPDHHLHSDSKDSVRLAMGFVATMSALILGLLVAAAKDSYDTQSAGVTQMAAKIVYLDRLLAVYGPEAGEVRHRYREFVEQATQRMWSKQPAGNAELDPSVSRSEEIFSAIQSLEPSNDLQRSLKAQAASASLEIGQLRWLEYEEASATASRPMIWILVFWTAVLFGSFGLLAPGNSTVIVALLLAALSVAAAIFLMLELQSPFSGFIQIPNTPFLDAIAHLGK